MKLLRLPLLKVRTRKEEDEGKFSARPTHTKNCDNPITWRIEIRVTLTLCATEKTPNLMSLFHKGDHPNGIYCDSKAGWRWRS